MTATTSTEAARPGRSLRRLAATAAAGIVLTLVPTAGTAGAETYTDPNDRCQPGADVGPAPVSDYASIADVHKPSVDCAFADGYSTGHPNGTFRPTDMTTRGQMATFIVRALMAAGYDLPDAVDPGFTDIAGNTHEDNIKILSTIGVTSGKTATTFAPDEFVRRDQMASFMVQAAEYAYEDNDFLVGEEPVPAFPDVPPSNVHYDNINSGALVLGLVDGKASGNFDPGMLTSRQQMASFLVRLVDLTLIVE